MSQANPNLPLTKITLLIVSTLTVMAVATIAPALPAMRANFADLPNVDLLVGLVLTIPGLSIVIGAPLAGMVVDRFGRKRLLIFSTVLYGISGSLGFFLESLTAILMSRALLGFAVAGIMTSVITLIADYYEGEARARFMGLQAAFMNLGGVVFTVTGGFLADVIWRAPFLIYLVAFAILPFIVVALFEPARERAPVQEFGLDGNDKVRFPFNRLVLVYLTALTFMAAFMLMAVQLPFFLEEVAGSSATQIGLAIAGSILFSIPPSLLYARISKRFDVFSIVATGFVLFSIGYTIIGFASGFWQVVMGAAVAGVGLGLLMPAINIWVTSLAPEIFRGRAFGLLTTFLFFGQFISPVVAQPVSQQFGIGMTFAFTGGLMFVIGAAFFIGARVSRTPVPGPVEGNQSPPGSTVQSR